MSLFRVKFKPVNHGHAKRILAQKNRSRLSAGHKALKAQAKEAQQRFRIDLRGGGAGSSKFDPLKNISRFSLKGDIKGPKRNDPGKSFARHVKMQPFKRGRSLSVDVGFVKGGRSLAGIAKIAQTGQTRHVTEGMRKFFRKVGAELRKKNKKAMMKYFFLKSTTTTFTTPAREMVTPFWKANERSIFDGVKRQYLRFVK